MATPLKTCGTRGALCIDGKWGPTEAPPTLSFEAAVKLSVSIADATASEDDGHIRFPITLTRASDWDLRLDYEIQDTSTATAGADYVDPKTQDERPGYILVPAGTTASGLWIDLIDDDVDDDGETIVVKLTGSRLVNPLPGEWAPNLSARISTATATGTISNEDPLPRAWLARFGRAAATHVMDAVEARLQHEALDSWARLGGYRIGGVTPDRGGVTPAPESPAEPPGRTRIP